MGNRMKKNILFIQGGGNGGYEADAKLAASLRQELGAAYDVRYPQLLSDETVPDFGWPQQIGKEISLINSPVILVGHSLGASMLLKYLSESQVNNRITGIFLISTPFWSGEEDWVQGLRLQEDFAGKLPKDVPIFLYHSRDDEVVPFGHLGLYKDQLPQATFREFDGRGHQFDNDLTEVAQDIKSLSR